MRRDAIGRQAGLEEGHRPRNIWARRKGRRSLLGASEGARLQAPRPCASGLQNRGSGSLCGFATWRGRCYDNHRTLRHRSAEARMARPRAWGTWSRLEGRGGGRRQVCRGQAPQRPGPVALVPLLGQRGGSGRVLEGLPRQAGL